MSITINAKGTSIPYFKIGKTGVTLYQGSIDPSLVYTILDGDYWLDSGTNAMKVWSVSTWNAPRLADLHFSGSAILAPASTDLTLSVDVNKNVVIDAGNTGPALMTTNDSQDLHINPAVGGGGYLVLCADRWPAADGLAGQVLTTDGNGTLYFAYPLAAANSAWDSSDVAPSNATYIPEVSTPPTAVPPAVAGQVPMVADSSTDKLWVYINGAWKSTTLT